jgi:hypothetical protein
VLRIIALFGGLLIVVALGVLAWALNPASEVATASTGSSWSSTALSFAYWVGAAIVLAAAVCAAFKRYRVAWALVGGLAVVVVAVLFRPTPTYESRQSRGYTPPPANNSGLQQANLSVPKEEKPTGCTHSDPTWRLQEYKTTFTLVNKGGYCKVILWHRGHTIEIKYADGRVKKFTHKNGASPRDGTDEDYGEDIEYVRSADGVSFKDHIQLRYPEKPKALVRF